jgi:porin
MYRTDQMSDLHGGVESHGGSINQFDLQLAVDADAAFGIPGLSFFAHAIANNGGSVSKYVGDAQIVSNIEATRLTKLYQFWVRQSFLDDRLSVLAGLYDLNAEFYVTDAAVVFLNSSFGVGKELAQTGPNGPGIFPNPALTLRLRGEFEGAYAQAAVIDGHPGTADDPFTPSFSWSRDQGVLVIAEGGVVRDGEDGGSRSKYAVGAWWYPPSAESPLPNGGAYLLAEQQVLREDGGDEGLSLFTRIGFAELRLNRYRANFSGGGVYTGLIPGRDNDRLGLGVTFAQRNELCDPAEVDAVPERGGEVSIELAYRIQLLSSIAVQPDFQYVIAPGCSRLVGNASVFGVRFEGHF